MFVWNWQAEQRLTSNKLTKRVNDISFAESGQFFVTAGSKALKYWYFNRMG